MLFRGDQMKSRLQDTWSSKFAFFPGSCIISDLHYRIQSQWYLNLGFWRVLFEAGRAKNKQTPIPEQIRERRRGYVLGWAGREDKTL